jgi:hypothetical protein
MMEMEDEPVLEILLGIFWQKTPHGRYGIHDVQTACHLMCISCVYPAWDVCDLTTKRDSLDIPRPRFDIERHGLHE